MPTYEYACRACDHQMEVVQSFSDDPLTTCPSCEGDLRKVFSPVGIAFKGSGFYKNDSRSSSSSTKTATVDKKESTSSESKSSDSTSTSKSSSTTKSSSTDAA